MSAGAIRLSLVVVAGLVILALVATLAYSAGGARQPGWDLELHLHPFIVTDGVLSSQETSYAGAVVSVTGEAWRDWQGYLISLSPISPGTTHGPTTGGATTHGPTTGGATTHGPTVAGPPLTILTSDPQIAAVALTAMTMNSQSVGVQVRQYTTPPVWAANLPNYGSFYRADALFLSQ
jgi:hypothetical protein